MKLQTRESTQVPVTCIALKFQSWCCSKLSAIIYDQTVRKTFLIMWSFKLRQLSRIFTWQGSLRCKKVKLQRLWPEWFPRPEWFNTFPFEVAAQMTLSWWRAKSRNILEQDRVLAPSHQLLIKIRPKLNKCTKNSYKRFETVDKTPVCNQSNESYCGIAMWYLFFSYFFRFLFHNGRKKT